jgi:hypothetical protein
MEYQAITPETPGLTDTFWAVRSDDTPVAPQLPYVQRSSETVKSTALIYNALGPPPEDSNVAYIRSLVLNCLSDTPVKLRLTSTTTLDLELYIDSYGYTQPTPVVLTTPPSNPFGINWPNDGKFIRSTSLYVFQGISIPEPSRIIWDARWPLVITAAGTLIPSVDSVERIRGEARAKIEDPELQPTFTTGLAGLAETSNQPASDVNQDVYNFAISDFLEENYNADDIPPPPTTIEEIVNTVVLVEVVNSATNPTPDELRAEAEVKLQALIDNDSSVSITPTSTGTSIVFNGTTTVGEYLGDPGTASEVLLAQALLSGDDSLTGFVEQLVSPDSFSLVLPPGFLGSVAALVGGENNAYFQQWVFYIRADPGYVPPVTPVLPGVDPGLFDELS